MSTSTEIERFTNEYQSLLDAGREDEARNYMMSEFPKLPEEARTQILTEMINLAIEEEVHNEEAIVALQETGIAALEELETIEKQQAGGGEEVDK